MTEHTMDIALGDAHSERIAPLLFADIVFTIIPSDELPKDEVEKVDTSPKLTLNHTNWVLVEQGDYCTWW
jgi:hypothetical protein